MKKKFKKKKLIKQLNRLLPEDWEVMSIFNEKYYMGSTVDDIYSLRFQVKKQPTKEELLEKAKMKYCIPGLVFKAISGAYVLVDDSALLIDDIEDDGMIKVSTNNEFCKYIAVYSKNYGWQPIIKKPIIKVQKWLYKGNDLFFIDKNNNWKLHKFEVLDQVYGEYNPEAYFITKQSALEYVLQEAKERFKGVNRILHNGEYKLPMLHDNFEILKEYHKNEIDCISYSNTVVWVENEGWIAEPIKETPLMLGDEVVEIKDDGTKPIKGRVKTSYYRDITIHCKGESVTKEEWMWWYSKFIPTTKFMTYFTMHLGRFETNFSQEENYIAIGCIGEITLAQIEAITKKLNEL